MRVQSNSVAKAPVCLRLKEQNRYLYGGIFTGAKAGMPNTWHGPCLAWGLHP
jgi:hypothetical protein